MPDRSAPEYLLFVFQSSAVQINPSRLTCRKEELHPILCKDSESREENGSSFTVFRGISYLLAKIKKTQDKVNNRIENAKESVDRALDKVSDKMEVGADSVKEAWKETKEQVKEGADKAKKEIKEGYNNAKKEVKKTVTAEEK